MAATIPHEDWNHDTEHQLATPHTFTIPHSPPPPPHTLQKQTSPALAPPPRPSSGTSCVRDLTSPRLLLTEKRETPIRPLQPLYFLTSNSRGR